MINTRQLRAQIHLMFIANKAHAQDTTKRTDRHLIMTLWKYFIIAASTAALLQARAQAHANKYTN